MKTNRSRGQPGFTAIDLMVLIIGVCVLGAIAFTQSPWVKEKKKQSICTLNLQRIGMAKEIWVKQNPGCTNACTMADVTKILYFRRQPACPSSGVYVVGPRGVAPTCSWHTGKL